MNATILVRIADQAEVAGITIMRTRDGEHFAVDPLDPTVLHRLTRTTCSCLHHVEFGRCRHHGLLLAELGQIEDGDTTRGFPWDPEPLAMARA